MPKVSAKDGASNSAVPPAEMNVEAELSKIYHAWMVGSKGSDKRGAENAKRQAREGVEQFSGLLKVARAGGKDAGEALKQARSILGQGGDPSSLDTWIHAHVDEKVMREAGLDPVEIAKSAGVEVEAPDVEEKGRDYQTFKGESGTVGPSGQGTDGVAAGSMPGPRRV